MKKILETAQKEGILEYAPANDKPQLTFTRERVAADNLQINLERYHFRKERAVSNVEAAIRYAETLRCRSRQLVAYFGEKESTDCGICDVCTGRNKPEFSEETYVALSEKIRSVLRDGPLGVHEIMEAFAPKRHEAVAKTLQYMLEEGILQEREDGGIAIKS